jgi:hypothetical protein
VKPASEHSVLQARYRVWRWRERLFRAVCIGVMGAAVGSAFWRIAPENFFIVGSFIVAIGFIVFIATERAAKNDLASFLRQLGAARPELECSTELLLKPKHTLSLLEELQLEKISAKLPEVKTTGLTSPVKLLGITVFVALAALMTSLVDSSSSTGASASPDKNETMILKNLGIEQVSVVITPPAYTRRAARKTENLNIDAEEGASVTWRITTTEPFDSARIGWNAGDTLRTSASSVVQFSRIAREPEVYAVEFFTHGKKTVLPFSKLAVKKDAPPIISVVTPEQRTVADDSAQTIWLKAVIETDTLAFEKSERLSAQSQKMEQALRLTRWQLSRGDELYFFVEARDSKTPAANVVRSETYIISIRDTTKESDIDALKLPLVKKPDYFRSQRQIIIDTEKLLAERKSMSAEDFNRQAESIGVDQKLLRLRYGRFLGEEFETEIGAMPHQHNLKVVADTAKNPLQRLAAKAAMNAPQDHSHSEPTAKPNEKPDNLAELKEPYMHRHDMEEAATFFSEPVKKELKAALAQMWDAELRLRVHEPAAALPYEYKALQLLKDLQQKSRSYVQRSGFEPPPINETELRFSGNTTSVKTQRMTSDVKQNPIYPAVRKGLGIVRALRESAGQLSAEDAVGLTAAGAELAASVKNGEPVLLNGLAALQKVLHAHNSRANSATKIDENLNENLNEIQAAFLAVLPEPPVSPRPQSRYGQGVAASYYQLLQAR